MFFENCLKFNFVGGATSSNAGDRLRTSESVAASFIRDRVTQQGESKLSEGTDSTFGKIPYNKKLITNKLLLRGGSL